VYVIQPDGAPPSWKVLTLQRAAGTRCPLTWETVHGHIEDGELPERAAIREVREETGLAVDRLYNVTVQPFYLHSINTIEMSVVFAAFVRIPAMVVLGPEHQAYSWDSVAGARSRYVWPRSRAALDDIVALLSSGDAGDVEDVLRVF
jgi:8-oxo-dGTP pyrophosphatase MutT (NUDIX family)